jgi:hypothetical protein
MKKLIVLVAALTFLAAFAPSEAGASPTLAQRVSRLEAKMSCLKRNPASSYLGYAWYEASGEVHALTDADAFTDSFWAAGFQQGLADATSPDYWLVAVRNTRACRMRFRIVANPYLVRTRRAGFQLRRLARAF